jgi:osmotically-inducible protein OsmY
MAVTLLALFLTGCNRPSGTESTAVDRDNSTVNTRDRDERVKTPIDQNENQTDIDITASIRKQVVDTEMSVNAQNVKIITQDGKVTLRGPVKSEEEKKKIEQIASTVAGADKVDNQLEVEQQP